MIIFALIGVKALYLLFVWLASAIAASWLSERKGYGEKVGLAFGLLLSAAGALIWLVFPARAESVWKRSGPFGRRSTVRGAASAGMHGGGLRATRGDGPEARPGDHPEAQPGEGPAAQPGDGPSASDR